MQRLAGLAVTLGLSGCPKRESDPPESPACPAPGHASDFDWVPTDAKTVIVVDRRSEDLEPALARTRTVAEHAASVGLPIRAAAALGQLGVQTTGLGFSFDRLGVEVDEWIEVHGPAGELVWLAPTACAPELLSGLVLARWNVLTRANLDDLIGSSTAEFPFDVLVLADGRVALASPGSGPDVLRWFRTQERREGPGPILAELAPAAVRVVISGHSLIAGEESPVGEGQAHTRTLRVSGESVELDGRVWAP